MVVAADENHDVSAHFAVHDRGTWMLFNDVLRASWATWTDSPNDQNMQQWSKRTTPFFWQTVALRRTSKINVSLYDFIQSCLQVFGAYCSTRWYERNVKDDKGQRQAYFGTGETFLFSLYPERAKYPWVGMDSSHNDSKVHHSAELFMAADSKMITIGGG